MVLPTDGSSSTTKIRSFDANTAVMGTENLILANQSEKAILSYSQ
jgi:hypothetical protein